MQKLNFFYDEDSASTDMVNIVESTKELLNQFGTYDTWENLKEIIDNAKKYTDTSSNEYSEIKPKELFGDGIKLDDELKKLQEDITIILNDIHDYLKYLEELINSGLENPDKPSGGGSYYSGGTTTPTAPFIPPIIDDGETVEDAPAPIAETPTDVTTTEPINDVGITEPPQTEVTTPNNPGKQQGTLYIEDDGTIDVFDANGKKIDTYGKGKYAYYEYRYDENGNPVAVRISPDGEEEKWVYLNNSNENVYFVDEGQKGTYQLEENSFPIYDGNNNQTGTVNAGNYKIYEIKYDENRNPIAVRISPDGEEEKWLHLSPGKTNGYYYEIGQKGNYFLRNGNLSIYDSNGNIVGAAVSGNYNVYGVKYGNDGNITAIKISKPGEEEKWLYLNTNNTDGIFIGLGQKGIYTLNGQTLKIFDSNNNVIGMLKDGDYSVYEVKYGSDRNITAVRISPNGKEEQWVYITNENGNVVGTFKTTEQLKMVDDGKVIINSTKKNNRSLKYLGILGGLSVALGTTLIIKKKINKQDAEQNEYENNEEYTEEPLEPGDYNVYEFKKDENNNITDARISEDGAKEELWVHF